jgi:hypothetical protein
MRFDERVEGDYRIYAGALEARCGDGYTAAGLAGGHRWESADEALRYALTSACQAIHSDSTTVSESHCD